MSSAQLKKPTATSGAGYFFSGFSLIQLKGIKRFVFIPLMVNLILFSIAFYFVFQQLDTYIAQLTGWLPEMLDWLNYLIWPIAVMTVLVVFSFLFSAVANWIAAPFNGLLAEKMELILTNQPIGGGGMTDIIKDIPRTLSREWRKLLYYIPRAVGFLILLWVLPVIGQVLWFLFVSWMMAIQYKDYAFDNHKIAFDDMKSTLTNNKGISFSFGVSVAVFSMIPIINLVVMPVAICGATALWVDNYREEYVAKRY